MEERQTGGMDDVTVHWQSPSLRYCRQEPSIRSLEGEEISVQERKRESIN